MSQLSAGQIKNKINNQLDRLNEQSSKLKDNLVEIYNLESNNRGFNLYLENSDLIFKSEPLKLFPTYEERIVFDNNDPLWKGEFYFINTENVRLSLVSFYVTEQGYVAVHDLKAFEHDVYDAPVYRAIFDQLFSSAISHKLITA